jgi:hypothetical protein|tara:strand:- start:1081 stop:1323 length:243 start_codon:yes stop_codon:yes gene_type:complete
MGKASKASFPMQGEVFKRETTNGYYNPTSVQQGIIQKKNRNSVAARQKLAKKTNLNPPQKSTRASEPVQSDAFKSGYRSS